MLCGYLPFEDNNNPNNLRLAKAYYMVVSNLWDNNGEK